MNSKNHFLRSLGAAFRGVFIFLLVLSVFSTTTPTRAAGGPDLVVSKSYSGNFVPLENGRTYTITVTNQGADPTDGTNVVVVDSLDSLPPRPDGAPELTATAISGSGWTCTLATLTCERSDVLLAGDSYSPITVTVNVLLEARNPLNNKATVSGGGELIGSTSNNETGETIAVDAKADLVILSYEIRDINTHAVITSPDADQGFYIRVKVKNQGGAGTGGVFYTGAYLDNKPNYGLDINPLGTVTPWSDFYTSQGLGGNNTGCLYYDPAPLINENLNDIGPYVNWGNYTRQNLNNALDPGTTEDVDIKIEYLPGEGYTDTLYDSLNIRSGLKAGTYTINIFTDPTCVVDEINEGKVSNSTQLNLTVAGEVGCNPPVGGAQVFQDVPINYWARDYIEAMYYCGYTAGCSVTEPLLFCPETVMNRAQSAVFLLRSRYGGSYTPPAPPYTAFSDNFSPGPWAEPWAQGLYNAGMTAGCANIPFLLFCPWEPATQAQLAVFGMRMKFGDSLPLPPATGTVFADMPITHWATGWAEQAYANDLILPCGSQGGQPLFCPDSLVSRASASYTIVKAKNLLP